MEIETIKAMMAFYLLMSDYGNFKKYLKMLEKELKNGNTNNAD